VNTALSTPGVLVPLVALSPQLRLLLTPGSRVEFHLAGRIDPGRGCVDCVRSSGVVILCDETRVYPGDKLQLLDAAPPRFPHRPEFSPEDQDPLDLPPEAAPAAEEAKACRRRGPRPARHYQAKECLVCHLLFIPTGPRSIYCPECRPSVYPRQCRHPHPAAAKE
jgi:hypothetical protein